MSFPGGLAYSGGANAYAYAYAYGGANAYAYSAPGEAAGIGGFAADPVLSAAVIATRDALLSEVPIKHLGKDGDRRDGVAFPRAANREDLPTENHHPDLFTYGTQVRSSLALFELSSSVAFRFDKPKAILESINPKSKSRAVLVTMERPTRTYFEGQLQLVDSWSSRRDVRAAEIITQVAPPLPYFAALLNMQAGRHRRTLEFVNAALQFTYAVCMQFKHALACPRPSEYSVGVQTMIEVPMHPTLPAGHAAEAHVTATLLAALTGVEPDSKTDAMLRRLAHRIAENRLVAGVHFPVDLTAGRLLGDALGSYVLARCGAERKWTGGSFAPTGAGEEQGQADTFDATDTRFDGRGCKKLEADREEVRRSDLLYEMWNAALAEWQEPKKNGTQTLKVSTP